MKLNEEKTRLALRVSMWFKGAFASLEIAGGILLFFVSNNFLISFILQLTQNELSEDPGDVIAHYFETLSSHLFSGTQYFVALYLLSHGLVKMIAIVGILKNKLWAYPTSIVIFLAFIVYQGYRYFHTYSVWLLLLTLIDVIIIWLVWREYRFIKKIKFYN